MPPTPASEGPKLKLMIIDDDALLLDVYARKFGERGYEVSTAEDGQKALTMLREGFRPALILLDIAMPKIDGFDLLRILNNEHLVDHTITIILSNQANEDYNTKAVSLGALGYIVKADAVPSEVVTKVEAIVAEHRDRLAQ